MDNNVNLFDWTYKNTLPQICGLYYNGIVSEIITLQKSCQVTEIRDETLEFSIYVHSLESPNVHWPESLKDQFCISHVHTGHKNHMQDQKLAFPWGLII